MPSRSRALFRPWGRTVGTSASPRSAPILYALAIYLGAFVVPGVGSTAAWMWGAAASKDPSLDLHYGRALRLQGVCLAVMVAIQGAVVGLLLSGFPWAGPAALRGGLMLAGLHLTAGVYLAMGLLGPVLLLADGPGEPEAARPSGGPSPVRRAPSAPSAPTRQVTPDRRVLVADRRVHVMG